MPELELDKVKPRLEPFLLRLLDLARLDVQFHVLPGSGQAYVTGTPDIVVNFDGGRCGFTASTGRRTPGRFGIPLYGAPATVPHRATLYRFR